MIFAICVLDFYQCSNLAKQRKTTTMLNMFEDKWFRAATIKAYPNLWREFMELPHTVASAMYGVMADMMEGDDNRMDDYIDAVQEADWSLWLRMYQMLPHINKDVLSREYLLLEQVELAINAYLTEELPWWAAEDPWVKSGGRTFEYDMLSPLQGIADGISERARIISDNNIHSGLMEGAL